LHDSTQKGIRNEVVIERNLTPQNNLFSEKWTSKQHPPRTAYTTARTTRDPTCYHHLESDDRLSLITKNRATIWKKIVATPLLSEQFLTCYRLNRTAFHPLPNAVSAQHARRAETDRNGLVNVACSIVAIAHKRICILRIENR